MTTFIIAPTDHAANTAVSAVRKSLESRPYLHFILVRGKQQGKGIAFSHIDITTDANKAAETAGEKIDAGTDKAVDATKEATQEVKDGTKELANDATAAAREAGQKAKEGVNDAATAVKEKTE